MKGDLPVYKEGVPRCKTCGGRAKHPAEEEPCKDCVKWSNWGAKKK